MSGLVDDCNVIMNMNMNMNSTIHTRCFVDFYVFVQDLPSLDLWS